MYVCSTLYVHGIISLYASDLVVGAPYETMAVERDTAINTGAVYIYYGDDSRAVIEAQEPQIVRCYFSGGLSRLWLFTYVRRRLRSSA